MRPGDLIICSSHMAVFVLEIGKAQGWPDLDDLSRFSVRVEAEVLVTFNPLEG